jgi:hypothetical protein
LNLIGTVTTRHVRDSPIEALDRYDSQK